MFVIRLPDARVLGWRDFAEPVPPGGRLPARPTFCNAEKGMMMGGADWLGPGLRSRRTNSAMYHQDAATATYPAAFIVACLPLTREPVV
jgi:hypothetical protein